MRSMHTRVDRIPSEILQNWNARGCATRSLAFATYQEARKIMLYAAAERRKNTSANNAAAMPIV